MAMSSNVHSESDNVFTSSTNLTECGICLGLIDDPKALPCLHAFCRGCLDEWTREQVDKTQVKCPVCKEDFTLSQEGGSGLHFFVNTLKEKEILQSNLKKEKLCCTFCDESDNIATSWCVNCSEKLCKDCVKCHKKLKPFQGHKIYLLDDIRANKVDIKKAELKRFCKKHEDQIPRFFCETCGVLICRDCTVVDHQVTKHTLVNVEEVSGEQLNMVTDLKDRCQNVASDVDDKIKEVINVQTDLKEALKKAHAEADRSVKQIKDDFLTKLEKQRQKISKDIDECGEQANVRLLEKKDKLEKQRLQLSRALTFSKSLCENGSPYDVAAVFTPLTDTMKRLSDLKMSGVQKDLSKIMFVEVTNYAIEVPPFAYVNSVQQSHVYRQLSGAWTLEKKLCEGHFKNGTGIASICSSHNVVIVSCTAEDKVKLFDDNGNFVNQISDDETDCKFHTPRSVVMTNDNSIVITDKSEFVKVFDSKDLKLISRFKTMPPVETNISGCSSLSGLAVSGNQLLISDAKNKYISVHKVHGGQHMRSFNVNISPYHISISPNGNTIVVSSTDVIQVINSYNGQILHKITRSVAITSYTTGSMFNGNGEFIAAKVSQPGICRYGIDGRYLGCITTNVDNPTDMLITEDGKLIVLEKDHIKVFKHK